MSKIEYSERGFAHTEPVPTSYGAQVSIYESSSAQGPHIWMNVVQPPPAYPGALAEGEVSVHMSLRQAEEVYARLEALIKLAKETWDESAWYDEDEVTDPTE